MYNVGIHDWNLYICINEKQDKNSQLRNETTWPDTFPDWYFIPERGS